MFVLCPRCQFLVAVDPASGLPPARCPRCESALATSTPEPATPVPAPAEPPQDGAEADRKGPLALPGDDSGPTSGPQPPPAADGPPLQDIAPDRPDVPDRADGDSEAPATAEPHAQVAAPLATVRKRSSALPILALSLLLVLQLALADRAQLASSAQWRPTLAALCGVLRCTLPPWHEPSALTFIDRDVAPDPRRPGVLHVTARFRNDARWTQAWPQLLLTLSDADGRVAGERAFAPAQYLGHRPTENGLASGQIVAIRMDVIEPAPHVVAFTFDFR